MKEEDLVKLEDMYNLLTYYKCGEHMKLRKKLYEEIKRVRKLLGYKKMT